MLALNRLRTLLLLSCLLVAVDARSQLPAHTDSGVVSAAAARALLDDVESRSWRQLQETAQALERALGFDPENIELMLLSARAQLVVAGPVGAQRAARYLDEVLRRQPKNGEALAQQALMLQRSGCQVCAQEAFDRARSFAPGDPWVREAYGYFLVTEGLRRLAAAITPEPGEVRKDYLQLGLAEYAAAIAAHSSTVRKGVIYRWIAALQERRGDRAATAAAQEKVLFHLPHDAQTLYRRAAAALYEHGDLETAGRLAGEINEQRHSAEARGLAAAVMYGAWATAWRREGDSEHARALLAAVRAAHKDTGEIFMRVSAAPQTAFIAKAMLEAGVFAPAPRDYRDKDGDTALASVILNYQRQRLGVDAKDAPILLELAEMLLARGSNANVWASDGRVPLLAVAARANDPELFARLLAAGADPHLRAADDSTVLMAVASVEDSEIAAKLASQLFAFDVDVLARNESARSALHYAAGSGNVTLLRTLLGKGTPIDVRDENNESPLDIAAAAGQRGAAEALLAAGAEVLIHDSPCGRHTTADIAERAGHPGLAELLRSRIRQSS